MTRGEFNTIIKKIQNECGLEDPTKVTYYWNSSNQVVFKIYFDSLYVPEEFRIADDTDKFLNTFSRVDDYLYDDNFEITKLNQDEGYVEVLPYQQDFKVIKTYKDANEAKEENEKETSKEKESIGVLYNSRLTESFANYSSFIPFEATKLYEAGEENSEADDTEENSDDEDTSTEADDDEVVGTEESDDSDEVASQISDMLPPSEKSTQQAKIDAKDPEKNQSKADPNASACLVALSMPTILAKAGSDSLFKTLQDIQGKLKDWKYPGKDYPMKLVFDTSTDINLAYTTALGLTTFSNIVKALLGKETNTYKAAAPTELSNLIEAAHQASEQSGTPGNDRVALLCMDKSEDTLLHKANISGLPNNSEDAGSLKSVVEEHQAAFTDNLTQFDTIKTSAELLLVKYRERCKKNGGNARGAVDTADKSIGGTEETKKANTGSASEKPKSDNTIATEVKTNKTLKVHTGTNQKDADEEKGTTGSTAQDQTITDARPADSQETDNSQTTSNTETPEHTDTDDSKQAGVASTSTGKNVTQQSDDWEEMEVAYDKIKNDPAVVAALLYIKDFYLLNMQGVVESDKEAVQKLEDARKKFIQDLKSGKVKPGSATNMSNTTRLFYSALAAKDVATQQACKAFNRTANEIKGGGGGFDQSTMIGMNAASKSNDTPQDDNATEEKTNLSEGYPTYLNIYASTSPECKKEFETIVNLIKGNKYLPSTTDLGMETK